MVVNCNSSRGGDCFIMNCEMCVTMLTLSISELKYLIHLGLKGRGNVACKTD